MKTRTCARCGETLHPFKDTCEHCGHVNELKTPWYTPLVGAALFVILILVAVDIPGLIEFLSRLLGGFLGRPE
jgi:hypothetical protein